MCEVLYYCQDSKLHMWWMNYNAWWPHLFAMYATSVSTKTHYNDQKYNLKSLLSSWNELKKKLGKLTSNKLWQNATMRNTPYNYYYQSPGYKKASSTCDGYYLDPSIMCTPSHRFVKFVIKLRVLHYFLCLIEFVSRSMQAVHVKLCGLLRRYFQRLTLCNTSTSIIDFCSGTCNWTVNKC